MLRFRLGCFTEVNWEWLKRVLGCIVYYLREVSVISSLMVVDGCWVGVSEWLTIAGLRLWSGVDSRFTLFTCCCTSLVVHQFTDYFMGFITGFSNYFIFTVFLTVYRAVVAGFCWF